MAWQFTLFAHLTILVALISIGLIAYALRYQKVPGAKALSGIMACYFIWAVTYALLTGNTDLPQKVFWAKVGYLGESLVAPFWLIFAFRYTRRDQWIKTWHLALFFVIPVLTQGLLWSQNYQWLMWTDTWLQGEILHVVHGPWFWVFISYTYASFFLGLFLLCVHLVRMRPEDRLKVASVILAGLAIWLIHFSYVITDDYLTQIILVPSVIMVSSILFCLGLFRFRLFEITPFARDKIIELMVDGFVVLDAQDRVVDINPSACKILAMEYGEVIGRTIRELFPLPNLVDDLLKTHKNNSQEISVGVRDYGFRAWPVTGFAGNITGSVLLIHDITDRKSAERVEKEQQNFSEAIHDSIAAINSTLCLDEVLDRLLTNVERVVPHDAVNIMLLDGNRVRMARHHGYSERAPYEKTQNVEMILEDVPSFIRMVETSQPVVVSDTQYNHHWVAVRGSSWVRSYTGTPIQARGQTLGFLNLNSAIPGFYTQSHAQRLKTFADQAAMAILNANLYSEVQQMALTDSLTGVYNRRALDELGKREVERALRFNRPLSALMLDVDHFKAINDACGHPVGDEVLLKLVECIRGNVRDIDILGRYGGDEFFLLLLESDLTTAEKVAERVRLAFQEHCIPSPTGQIHGTISVGVAGVSRDTADFNALVARADQALYRAKDIGRNQTAVLRLCDQGKIGQQTIVG